jgi:hypothetical protein
MFLLLKMQVKEAPFISILEERGFLGLGSN